MFLCRIRLGLGEQDLSIRFNVSVSTASRKNIAWANILYLVLGHTPIWLSKDTIANLRPQTFKELYPHTRVILVCTEIYTETPSTLVLGSQFISSYKSHNTVKGLIGIAPHGVVTFVSQLYTGCTSDVEITKDCSILELIEEGDGIMADKGFPIEKLLKKHKAHLTIPPFLTDKGQFSPRNRRDRQNC